MTLSVALRAKSPGRSDSRDGSHGSEGVTDSYAALRALSCCKWVVGSAEG